MLVSLEYTCSVCYGTSLDTMTTGRAGIIFSLMIVCYCGLCVQEGQLRSSEATVADSQNTLKEKDSELEILRPKVCIILFM